MMEAWLCLCILMLCGCTSVKKASQRQPDRPRLSYNDEQRFKYFYLEAVNQQNLGNYDAAFDLYRHCLDIDPNAAEVYFALSAYYAELDADSTSLALMQKAVDLDSDNDIYLERLGITHINANQFSEAAQCYEQLFSLWRHRQGMDKSLPRVCSQKQVPTRLCFSPPLHHRIP